MAKGPLLAESGPQNRAILIGPNVRFWEKRTFRLWHSFEPCGLYGGTTCLTAREWCSALTMPIAQAMIV